MIEGQTIICFASNYDAPPTSKHHVMHLLAEGNTVLWVNYHASRTPTASSSDLAYMARKLGQVFSGLKHPRPNLHLLTPLVVPLPSSPLAKRINRALMIAQVRLALWRLRSGPVQVWSFTPDISYLLGHFGEERVLYYCVDDFAHFSGYDTNQVLRDEADLCRRADLVVTTSLPLQEAKQKLNPRTMLVHHGVDFDHFAQAVADGRSWPEPAALAAIPHPRLGFFGLIRDWVDLDLLAEVARRRPTWQMVMIGDSTVDLGPYRSLGNMHFLGRKSYQELPAYCRWLDAGLIPFRINELTLAVNPIKLREYLAAGLPVVSTPLPEVVSCGHQVFVGDTVETFTQAAEAALASLPGGGADELLAARRRLSQQVASETWPAKLEAISAALEAGGGRRAGDQGGRP